VKKTSIPYLEIPMKIASRFRRTAASALLTAGLAYPACAAVCPKGIGGCPAPGRCFLFTDADANLFCDYTSRTGSQAPGVLPSPDPTVVQITATPPAPSLGVSATTSPAPLTETTTTVLQNVSQGGISDVIHLAAPFVAGVALFLVVAGTLFLLARSGVLGIPAKQTRPTFALSAFFGLGLSLIITFFLAGGTLAGTTCALIWMGAGTPIAAYLWYGGVMSRKIVLGTAALGTLAGFIFLAPIMPLELGGVVNVLTGVSVPTLAIIVIFAIILLALVTGRTFCGNICPVGSLQELAYSAPLQKYVIRHTGILEIIRLVVFFATVIAAVYLVDLMAVTGLYDLFSLTVSAGLFTATALILISLFLYRPICRTLCPFGVLFSIPSMFSLFRLRRTECCIGCKKCEKACPARTAGAEDPKRECYLCARCTDACPVQGALLYCR
jgi:ferredoxin-type protein NapH